VPQVFPGIGRRYRRSVQVRPAVHWCSYEHPPPGPRGPKRRRFAPEEVNTLSMFCACVCVCVAAENEGKKKSPPPSPFFLATRTTISVSCVPIISLLCASLTLRSFHRAAAAYRVHLLRIVCLAVVINLVLICHSPHVLLYIYLSLMECTRRRTA
jgi:hypothetical protein